MGASAPFSSSAATSLHGVSIDVVRDRLAQSIADLDRAWVVHAAPDAISHKEFWLVDLETGRERQLTNLGREFAIGDFDVSLDGREIIFDRARDESDIVVFAMPLR